MENMVRMVTDSVDAERALQNAPPEVQGFQVQHRDKGTQGVYVGRSAEEDILIGILRSNVNPQSESSEAATPNLDQLAEQSGGKGIIIAAPPGAGKSTLLDHVLQKVEQEGIGVVRISHESLANANTLNEKIRSQDPWRSWIRQPGLPAKLTDAVAAGADTIIRILLQTVGDTVGMQINSNNVEVFTRLIDGWRQHETFATLELLQQMDSAYPNGFVFALDEAQQLRRHLEHDWTCTSTVLNTLGDPNTRREAGIAHGTIMLVGLGDTEQVVSKFGTLRQQVFALSPIRPDAVAKLIEVRIRSSGCSLVECDAAVQAWGPPLVAEFGTWTHHAQCAAYAAQQVLYNFKHAALETDWGWPLVRREALRGVHTLYVFVTKRAMEAVGAVHMHTIAHAMRGNNNYIAYDTFVDLVALTEQARIANMPHPAMPTKEIIEELLHAGLIARAYAPKTTAASEFGDAVPDGFCIGIPSVSQFLTKTPPDVAMLERIAACQLRVSPVTE